MAHIEIKPVDMDRLVSLRIAFLYSLGTLSYKEIAERVGVSPSTVTRRIQYAKKAGWLRTIFEIPDEYEDLERYVRSEYKLEKELRKRLGDCRIDAITVAPTGEDPMATLRNVGAAGALLVGSKLGSSEVCAVNWGLSVRTLIQQLRPPTNPNKNMICVPLFGDIDLVPSEDNDPMAFPRSYYNCSRIADLLARKYGATSPLRLSFRSFIPSEFSDSQREVIRHYIETDLSFQAVYGEEGLIHRVDSLLTGIGSFPDSAKKWLRIIRYLDDEEVAATLDKLKNEMVVGDIAQNFTTRGGLRRSKQDFRKTDSLIDKLNQLVVGIDPLEHFKPLVERHRAQPEKGTGVVIVASGRRKAPVTIAAIRSEVVSNLIIDEKLAEGIIAELDLEADRS